MRFLISTQTFAFLALMLNLVFAQASTNSPNVTLNFNCSSFNVGSDGATRLNYTVLSNQTHRVSRAVVCSPNAGESGVSCTMTASGRLSINATSNATDIPDANLLQLMLYKALKSRGASSTELSRFDRRRDRVVFNGTGQVRTAQFGTPAYIGFRPNMTCHEGVVSTDDSCDGTDEGVKNVKERFEGRALSICVPTQYRRVAGKHNTIRVAGTLELVEITEEEARSEDMKRNPAQTESSDDEDEDEDDRESGHARPSSTSVVGRSGIVGICWTSMLMGAFVAIGMIMII
jgi:hypothetical protein